MRFRKPIFTKAKYLLVNLRRKLVLIATRQHAGHQTLFKMFKAALAAPRRHRAAQLISLAGGETRRYHRQLHDLFLKNRHAQRAFKHAAHRFVRIGHWLAALPPLQIRMHHAALNRPRPYDRHLNHQIVEFFRFESRQHAHLRARFDLEDADGIGTLDHFVDGGIFRRHISHAEGVAATLRHQIKRTPDRREHAEC